MSPPCVSPSPEGPHHFLRLNQSGNRFFFGPPQVLKLLTLRLFPSFSFFFFFLDAHLFIFSGDVLSSLGSMTYASLPPFFNFSIFELRTPVPFVLCFTPIALTAASPPRALDITEFLFMD